MIVECIPIEASYESLEAEVILPLVVHPPYSSNDAPNRKSNADSCSLLLLLSRLDPLYTHLSDTSSRRLHWVSLPSSCGIMSI